MKTLITLAILLTSNAMASTPDLDALRQNEHARAAAVVGTSSTASATHINQHQNPVWIDPWYAPPTSFWIWSSFVGEPVLPFTDIFAPPEQLQVAEERFIIEALYFCPTP